LKKALETNDVAVVIDATHLCVSSRGVKDVNSSTVTSHFSGNFLLESKKTEFLKYVEL
jgi:GTP cyclohydrolase I